MQQEIIKHKLVERYLNRVEFNGIRIGSLIAQYYALNFMNPQYAKSIIGNLVVLFKYSLTLWNNKKVKPQCAVFLFTKLNNRFHFNALMDPIIHHYYDRSVIVCDENSFDKDKFNIQDIQSKAISFKQTNSNSNKDAFKILKTLFIAFYILTKNRKRLRLSFSEVMFFGNNLLVQLRRASFWDRYFSLVEIKPLCLVTEYDRSYNAAPLVLAARKHKIQTVTLIHGVLEDYGFTPFLADNIFCWGESQKSHLIAKCVDPQMIFITGNPIFDSKSDEGNNSDRVFNGLNICLAIGPGFDNRLLIDPFVSVLNLFENAHGIIKLHPSLSKDEYKWVENLSSRIEVLSSADIKNEEVFINLDLLIINDSGIANEALAAGVPVAILVPPAFHKLNIFQNELHHQAECRLVTNEAGLKEVFTDILKDPLSFKKHAVAKSKDYLINLYGYTGEFSVQEMISKIGLLSQKNII